MQKDIGKFMQETRKSVGLTQKEIADRIGVSDKTISKWENGNSVPDTSILLALCRELNITVNELLSCERISSENYSMKAEETIMTLMQENEMNKKSGRVSKIIGGIVLAVGMLFLAISLAGVGFPLRFYIDLPSLITIVILSAGVVLVSGARKRESVLLILSKTIMPIGLFSALVSSIIVLVNLSDIELLGPNLAVVFLTLLYAAIIKIIVELLLARE